MFPIFSMCQWNIQNIGSQLVLLWTKYLTYCYFCLCTQFIYEHVFHLLNKLCFQHQCLLFSIKLPLLSVSVSLLDFTPCPCRPKGYCRCLCLSVVSGGWGFSKVVATFNHVGGSFNIFMATTRDVWIIPSFPIWDYVLHVEHISCVITNCG